MRGGNGFATIGFCSTIGSKGYVYVGVASGIATFILMKVANPASTDYVTPVLVGLGTGGIIALSTYFTCRGVSEGFPVRRAKRR